MGKEKAIACFYWTCVFVMICFGLGSLYYLIVMPQELKGGVHHRLGGFLVESREGREQLTQDVASLQQRVGLLSSISEHEARKEAVIRKVVKIGEK